MVDYFRKKTKRVSVPIDDAPPIANGNDIQLITEQKLDIEQMLSASKRLTEAQREVISLRFPGGLSIAEAARVMGKSQGAIKALQHSAIVALRRILLVTES